MFGVLIGALMSSLAAAGPAPAWKTLQPGVDYWAVDDARTDALSGDGRLHIVRIDLNGSYETDFNENDDEKTQWPIPNVLAVPRR